MSAKKLFCSHPPLIWIVALIWLCWSPLTIHAEDMRIKAQLVWGTNQEKPEEPNVKEVAPDLRDKLRKIFKWKNYFEVSAKPIGLNNKENKKVRMSAKCEVEIKSLGDKDVEVNLWGEGKLVVTKRLTLSRATSQAIAGDDKNDSAWFVVLTLEQ